MVTVTQPDSIASPLQLETGRLRRVALALCVVAALAIGAAGGAAFAPSAATDPDLLVLVRFMAFVKSIMALGAAAVVAWRLTLPISGWAAAAYIASASLMALAPGLIWHQVLTSLASAVFHTGLLSGLVLAACDGVAKRRT